MKIRFVLYVGNNECIKEVGFAENADESEIEQAFYDWKVGLFYSFRKQCDE
ncbi:hypothetical protein [Moraxella lacunata]|uniref:hypothetical protein n=1 Tax=Moraxella lacunata TaxID=477 RepID=UPI0012DFDBC2|nr:hypothetical protein [Moraxella lacunata]